MATDGHGQMTRRTFCNGALIMSAGVILLANEVRSQKQGPRETLLAYPPQKIEGAAELIAGSYIYFEYPKSGVVFGPPPRPLDQIVLQVRAGGEVWAVGKRLGGDTNV